MENKTITLNQYNIVGQKRKIDFDKIKNNLNIEYVILKKFNITTEIVECLNTLSNLNKIWFVDCDMINKFKIKQLESLIIENCNNIDNIIFNNNLERLYIRNCKKIDVKEILNLKELKTLEFEYEKVENLQLLNQFESLENLYLKELDLTTGGLTLPKTLKKIVLNGSKVKQKEKLIESLKKHNIEVEFYNKNLPIG